MERTEQVSQCKVPKRQGSSLLQKIKPTQTDRNLIYALRVSMQCIKKCKMAVLSYYIMPNKSYPGLYIDYSTTQKLDTNNKSHHWLVDGHS